MRNVVAYHDHTHNDNEPPRVVLPAIAGRIIMTHTSMKELV